VVAAEAVIEGDPEFWCMEVCGAEMMTAAFAGARRVKPTTRRRKWRWRAGGIMISHLEMQFFFFIFFSILIILVSWWG
jgi:hypothetical protein